MKIRIGFPGLHHSQRQHGVYCKCGRWLFFDDDALTPPITIVKCPVCGHTIEYVSSHSRFGQRTICVKPSCFAPEFEMIISIPNDRNAEEYIDELLDAILSEECRFNAEWDFVDGLS